MRALKAAVVIMGVLIVAGVVTIVVTIVERTGRGTAPALASSAVLDEPAGTRIAGTGRPPRSARPDPPGWRSRPGGRFGSAVRPDRGARLPRTLTPRMQTLDVDA